MTRKRLDISAQQIDLDTAGEILLTLMTIVWSQGGQATEQVEAMLRRYGIKHQITEVPFND